MNTKTNKDEIGHYESVVAVIRTHDFEKRTLVSIELENDYEYGKLLTFQNVLDECRNNGYTGKGTVLLICESFLDGKIYRYGNYGDDKWYEVGTMVGFA